LDADGLDGSCHGDHDQRVASRFGEIDATEIAPTPCDAGQQRREAFDLYTFDDGSDMRTRELPKTEMLDRGAARHAIIGDLVLGNQRRAFVAAR
jgi:hypothetical protein